LLTISLLVPAGDAGTAEAKGRRGAVSKSKSKKAKRAKSRRSHRRSYTLRGNPEVTRNVALKVLTDKLPDLAAVVGLQADPSLTQEISLPQPPESPATLVSLADRSATPGLYQDSEYGDSDDPDGLGAEDEEELEDLPDDINFFYREFTSYMASLHGEPMVTDNGIDKQVAMEAIVSWLGTRYLFGGMTRSGIDCSAFTGTVYRSLDYRLPRTAAAQWEVGSAIDRDALAFGDLVFFHTRSAVYVSHVGMYLGNGQFVHASSRNGVTISSLESEYYSSHYI
jgi:hypothetical protein